MLIDISRGGILLVGSGSGKETGVKLEGESIECFLLLTAYYVRTFGGSRQNIFII
jgi:hypothetical protein